MTHHSNLSDTARLFAILNVSFADTVIAFYDARRTVPRPLLDQGEDGYKQGLKDGE